MTTTPRRPECQAQVSASLQPADLLHTLMTYPLPPTLPGRVQQEQGWTAELTQQAVQEYRRFLFLAATARRTLTPSQVVDEVWHTHLTYTRDYWERLTPLLPGPLHHEPSSGQPDSPPRHARHYLDTLDAYQATFGERPPQAVWPDPRQNNLMAAPAVPSIPATPPQLPKLPKLLWPVLAAGVAWMTFAWSSAAGWIALGTLLVGLLMTGLGQAAPPDQRASRRWDTAGAEGDRALLFAGGDVAGESGQGCGDSGGSACGGSCGSGCGGGCGT